MKRETLEAEVRNAYPMPENVRKHARAANWDVHFGPLGPDHWRDETGDSSAPDYDYLESRQVLIDWVEEIGTIYIDEGGGVSTHEPQGSWYDPETDQFYDDQHDAPDPERCRWCEPWDYYIFQPQDIAEAFGYREV